jgi:hypothetical protein
MEFSLKPWGNLDGTKIDHKVAINPNILTDRAWYPRVDTSPLAIITLSLTGLSTRGLPHTMVNACMEGYFIGERESNLIVHNLEFSIDSISIPQWTVRINKVVQELKRCACNVCSFLFCELYLTGFFFFE